MSVVLSIALLLAILVSNDVTGSPGTVRIHLVTRVVTILGLAFLALLSTGWRL